MSSVESADTNPEPKNSQGVLLNPPTEPTQTAAFFDIDETLIRGASAFHVAKELHQRGFFGKRDIAFAAWHAFLYRILGENKDRIKQVIDRGLHVMAGRKAAELDEIAVTLFDKLFSHRIIPGTRKILEQHLKRGHEVWLISATPTQVSALLADRLGATGALGTQVKVDKDGNFLPQLVGQMMHLQGKASAAQDLAERRHLDLDTCFAYGDSINDLPLLNSVGFPCAINPEPLLRLVALEKDWPIHSFRKRINISALAKRAAKTAAGGLLISWLYRRYSNPR